MNGCIGITVAVIGAGQAGVAAVKCALDEGLQPTCFEQDDQLGGTWYYTKEIRPNQGAGGYEELKSVDHKDHLAFSDYPMPEHYPQYLPWHQTQQYLKDYAEHFGVTQRIQFNTRVVKVTPTADHAKTGRWEVHTQKKGSSTVEVHKFDKVMMATGPFRSPIYPDIPGMKDFKGQIMHIKDYREKSIFKGKRVLVYASAVIFGAEITSSSGAVADQTYLVVPSDGGFYLFPRNNQDGCPLMMTVTRNMLDMPWEVIRPMVTAAALEHLDTDKYDLSPKFPLLNGGRLSVSDTMPDQIKEGKVIPKRGIKRFTETGVVFDDGSEVHDIDLVVLSTGFGGNLDIIDVPSFNGVKGKTRRENFDLYMWEFPVDSPHHSLAFIDFGSWYQPHIPICELQSRLAARVFTGKHQLPSQDTMKKWIEKVRIDTKEKTNGKFMTTPFVASDEIARELGVLPSFWRLFWTDPILAHSVYYGPTLSIVYRLVGPGSQKSAWKEYYNWCKRVFEGAKPPPIPWGIHHYILASLLVAAIAIVVAWFS